MRPFLELLRLPFDGFEGRALTDVADVLSGRDQLEGAVSVREEASPVVSLEMRPRHASVSVGVTARVFPALDGRPGWLVLLMADSQGTETVERA
jgi:hypothetical protein